MAVPGQAPDPATAVQGQPQTDTTAPPQPATQPAEQSGNAMLAKVRVQTAMQILKSALPLMDLGTKEGKALLTVMKTMVNHFGPEPEAQSLVPAQVLEMVRATQQGGQAPLQQQ